METGAFRGTASRPLAPADGKTFAMTHEDCCFYGSNRVMSHTAGWACGGRGVFSPIRLFSKLLFWALACEIVFRDPNSFSEEPLLIKAF